MDLSICLLLYLNAVKPFKKQRLIYQLNKLSVILSSAFRKHYSYQPILLKLFGAHKISSGQDRRWNAEKPSAALDPYISTWLTTSPDNHKFWNFCFLKIGREIVKSGAISVWTDEDQLQIWSSHSLIVQVQNITYIIYQSIMEMLTFSQHVTEDNLMLQYDFQWCLSIQNTHIYISIIERVYLYI